MEFPNSSRVKSAAYDPDSRDLHVTFRWRNQMYTYHGVSPEYFEQMKKSASAGKFIDSHIKGKHRHSFVARR